MWSPPTWVKNHAYFASKLEQSEGVYPGNSVRSAIAQRPERSASLSSGCNAARAALWLNV
jgi:hypothetical protein